MTLLDYHNLNYYNSNHFTNFEQNQQLFQDPYYCYYDDNELLLPLETELLCFDPLPPPPLFDVHDDFEVPLFIPPPPIQLDHNNFGDSLIIPEAMQYNCVEFAPLPNLPTTDSINAYYPYQVELEEEDYSQFIAPLHKKQKLCASCCNGFVPECGFVANNGTNYPTYQHCFDHDNVHNVGGEYNGVCIEFNKGCGDKDNEVSRQSNAARERRRRIAEKTQELGKLVPGGTKMNTAEMFQAAYKYVQFLQAQLSVLQSVKTLHEEGEKEVNLKYLPILASQVVQEKLYSKEKCLVPKDFMPKLEEQCDFEENPSVSKHINDLLKH